MKTRLILNQRIRVKMTLICGCNRKEIQWLVNLFLAKKRNVIVLLPIWRPLGSILSQTKFHRDIYQISQKILHLSFLSITSTLWKNDSIDEEEFNNLKRPIFQKRLCDNENAFCSLSYLNRRLFDKRFACIIMKSSYLKRLRTYRVRQKLPKILF